jgi:hypothetical protein
VYGPRERPRETFDAPRLHGCPTLHSVRCKSHNGTIDPTTLGPYAIADCALERRRQPTLDPITLDTNPARGRSLQARRGHRQSVATL